MKKLVSALVERLEQEINENERFEYFEIDLDTQNTAEFLDEMALEIIKNIADDEEEKEELIDCLSDAIVEALESFEEYRKEKISGNKKLVYFEKETPTMTVLELSHELIDDGYDDIYDIGTIETNILEENSIVAYKDDKEILISIEVIEKLDKLNIAKIKVLKIEEI